MSFVCAQVFFGWLHQVYRCRCERAHHNIVYNFITITTTVIGRIHAYGSVVVLYILLALYRQLSAHTHTQHAHGNGSVLFLVVHSSGNRLVALLPRSHCGECVNTYSEDIQYPQINDCGYRKTNPTMNNKQMRADSVYSAKTYYGMVLVASIYTVDIYKYHQDNVMLPR